MIRTLPSLSFVLLLALPLAVGPGGAGLPPAPTEPTTAPVADLATATSAEPLLARSGIHFEPNLGQFHPEVLFAVRGADPSAYITRTGAVFVLAEETRPEPLEPIRDGGRLFMPRPTPVERLEVAVALRLGGMDPLATATGLEPLPGVSNHFIGDDPAKWITQVGHFGRVSVRGVYPGIDLVWYAEGRSLKYDFVVAPGADPGVIRLDFEGADTVRTDAAGRLVLETPLGPLVEDVPRTFQDGRDVANRYVVDGASVRFDVAPYDTTKELVIDPLVYSTFIGGSSQNDGRYGEQDIAVDATGNAYVVGSAGSSTFPTTFGAYRRTYAGGLTDLFVAKVNPTGSSLLYSTFIGGNDFDLPYGIAVDATGNAYITGYTWSWNYPVTTGAFQTAKNNNAEIIVTKLNAGGSALSYSTFLGGSPNGGYGQGIAVDGAGNAYITGWTNDWQSFPTTPGAYQTSPGFSSNAFVVKFNPTGSGLVYSTLLGGINGLLVGRALALDASGNVFLTGYGTMGGLPATPGAYRTTNPGGDSEFVLKLNAAGSGLLYATWIGGSLREEGTGIAVDVAGNAYVTGFTNSTDRPATSGAFQTTRAAPASSWWSDVYDGFVSKVNPTGSALVYSTYLGGNAWDSGNAIAVDASGQAYVAGSTGSSNFPTTAGAVQTTYGGDDVFVTKLNAAGSGLSYSTYLGVWASESSQGIVFANGAAFITGYAGDGFGQNFPTTPGAYQTTHGGGYDVFAAKLAFSPPTAPRNPTTACLNAGTRLAWEAPLGVAEGTAAVAGYRVYWGTSNPPTNAVEVLSPTRIWDHVPPWSTTTYHYQVSAYNSLGESARTTVVSRAPCDLLLPTVSGAGQFWTWRSTVPTLSGVSWSDAYSGLATGAQYSVGTTSGATDVVAWTTLPTQPSSGQTTAWSPSWTPSTLAQGLNYVNMRVSDRQGNLRLTNGAYTVQFDTVAPVPGVSSTTHADPTRSYSQTTASVQWAATDAHSGIDGYQHLTVTGACPASTAGGTWVEQTTTQASVPVPGPFQQHRFCIQARDNVGNWGAVVGFAIHVDTVAPVVVSQAPAHGALVTDPLQAIEVHFHDDDGGLDAGLPPRTVVDVNAVQLVVDGEDMVAKWRGLCAPGGPLPTCRLEVTTGHIRFEPPVPWAQGTHAVTVVLPDNVQGANVASASWSFVLESEDAVDADGDLVPDALEPTLCTNENPNLLSDGHCTGGDYMPPTADDVVSDAIWLATGERP